VGRPPAAVVLKRALAAAHPPGIGSAHADIEEVAVHVGVIHHISDPQGFEDAEQRALEAGLPESFKLPVHAATPDHSTGICIWEGPSVDAVRDLVESVVGDFSRNEYYELELDAVPA
jgi:hypothetical protein